MRRNVRSPLEPENAGQVSKTGRAALVEFEIRGDADDALDKIDPKALAQNVAAYTVFTYLAADAVGDFGSAPKAAQP